MSGGTSNLARLDDDNDDTHLTATEGRISTLLYLAKRALVKREASKTQIGIILGGIVALTLLIAFIGCWCSRRRGRSLYIPRTGVTRAHRQSGRQRRWGDSMQPPAPAYEGYRLPRYSTH